LCARRRDCKKYDEIRIFVMAVTGSLRHFEKEFARIDRHVLRWRRLTHACLRNEKFCTDGHARASESVGFDQK
jgi:hypothetical protein